MKQIIAMILTAILLLSACGQKEPALSEVKTQTPPEIETETDQPTAFFADKNVPEGMVAVWYRTKQISRGMVETQEWIDTYDETGNLLMLSRFPAGGYCTEYKYGDDGKLVETTYFPNDEKGDRVTYEYDSAGNVIKEITFDNEEKEVSRIVRTYDDNGNLLKAEHILPGLNILEEYSYDSQNRVVQMAYYQCEIVDGQEIEIANDYLYEYGENDSYKLYANGVLEREERFDEEKRPIEAVTYADGVEVYKQLRQYDDDGNLIQMSIYEDSSLCNQYDYQYDSNGNLLEKSSPLDQSGEKRVYDSAGNITEYAEYLEDGVAHVQVKAQYDDGCHVEITTPASNDFVYTGTISYENDDTIYIELESADGQYGAQWTYERVIVTPQRAEELTMRYGDEYAIVFENLEFPILVLISAKG